MREIQEPYSLHPAFAHWSAMLENLSERTGKDRRRWVAELRRAQAETPEQIRTYLRMQGLGASTIGLIADAAAGKSPETYNPQAYVDQMFKGPKTALLPLYETVLHFALNLGTDVKACPCATMVPLYRNHVFAQLKPSTKNAAGSRARPGEIGTNRRSSRAAGGYRRSG